MPRHEKRLHIGCWGWGVSAYDAKGILDVPDKQMKRWNMESRIFSECFFCLKDFQSTQNLHTLVLAADPPPKKCTTPVPPKFHQSHHRPAGLPLLALGAVLLLGASGTSGMICWCLACVRIGSAGGAMCSLCLLNQYVGDIGYENCET